MRFALIPVIVIIGLGAVTFALAIFGDFGGGSPGKVSASSEDGDGDGIPDDVEIAGWRTERGDRHVTESDNPDSDGDGLSDGEEAGSLTGSPSGGGTYAGKADPNDADSDDDGLDDATERDGEFNAWEPDTDGDSLDDLLELEFGSDPLSPNADEDHLEDAEELREGSDPHVYDLTGTEASAAFVGGAVVGDCEYVAGKAQLSDAQLESWHYLAGSLASGVNPAADARDTACNLAAQDWSTARDSLLGLLPVAGDAAKASKSAIKFAKAGGRATPAAMHFIATTRGLKFSARERAIRKIVRLDPGNARLTPDAAVRGAQARPALSPTRPVSRSASQNARKDKEVRRLKSKGYTDIRVNERQVNADDQVVGVNRPDIQATDAKGKRHYYLLDSRKLKRGASLMVRVLSNDVDADVHLIVQD